MSSCSRTTSRVPARSPRSAPGRPPCQGTNTYSGTTTISAGGLQVGNNGATGTLGTGAVINNATLLINRSDASFTLSNDISGTGALTKTTAGVGTTLVLTGANSYSGTTTINEGTLQVGAGGTVGTLGTGGVTAIAGTTLAINRSNAITLGNVISGTGALTQIGAGTTSLTGASTYSGGTTITAGTLSIGAGGTTGSVAGNIVNNAALAFNRSNSLTYGGVVSGTGTLNQVGTGTTTLTGTSTYTGATTVTAGTLLVEGSIATSSGVTVGNGGTLRGTGTVAATTIASGGTLAAGNAGVGTLAVAGNLTMAGGAITAVRTQGATIDTVTVTGAATLAGGVQVTSLSGAFNSTYTFLTTTGGRTGTFSSSSFAGGGGGILPTVTYDANNAYLTLTALPLTPIITALPTTSPGLPAFTLNQLAVAGGLDRAVAAGGNASPFFALYNLPVAAIPEALDQISGIIHASIGPVGALVSGEFLNLMTDLGAGTRAPFGGSVQAQAAASADGAVCGVEACELATAAEASPSLTAWIGSIGSARRVVQDPIVGAEGPRNESTGGVAVGADADVARGARIGLAVSSGIAAASLATYGSLQASVFQAGVYGQMQSGPLQFKAAMAYTTLDVATNRAIPILGQPSVTAGYRTHGMSGRVEGSYDVISMGGVTLVPNIAAQAAMVWRPGFQEFGYGTPVGLTATPIANFTARGELGARVDYRGKVAGRETTAFVRSAWVHYFARDANMNATLTQLPGAGFTIVGARPDPNGALLSTGFDVKVTEQGIRRHQARWRILGQRDRRRRRGAGPIRLLTPETEPRQRQRRTGRVEGL